MMTMTDEWRDLFTRHNIDPNTVIDAEMDVRARYMFRTPGEYPWGGMHYEAQVPRSIGDKQVAARTDATITVKDAGLHPEAEPQEIMAGEMLTSVFVIHEDGRWVYDEKETA